VRSSTPLVRYVFPLPHSLDALVLFTRHSPRLIDIADVQDEYTLFSHKYANGVHGYVLVYSINSRQSFDMIQTIYDKILDYSGMGSMPMVIVGQKADLSGERYVSLTSHLHELTKVGELPLPRDRLWQRS